MRKIYLKLLFYCFAFIFFNNSVSSQVVISQVYGGGGNTGATYTNDFIEIFNRGTSPVNLAGWSVQYASATGTSWQKTDLTNVTLAPGQHYLIQEAQGAGGTTSLPIPDAVGTIAMSGTAGKVILLNVNTLITSGTSCPTGASVQNIAGFGTTANCFEGTGPTPAPSNTNAVLRVNNGCTDDNNNATDFTAGSPNPRNTFASLSPCSGALSVSVATGINASEPSTNGTFTVNLSDAAPVGGVTVTYGFSGSATFNTDYTDPLSGTVTIPQGFNSAVITLNVNDDADVEGTEAIQITLTAATSPVIISTGTASINLSDNDLLANPYISLINSYTQDFNTLAASGTSSIVPAGWLFAETAANANTLYSAGTGSSTSGNTYSFGTAAIDRAFGTLQSGSLISTIGAQIQNNSGSAITKLKISYTGEEWRLGTVSRTDKLSFQYSLDATTLSNGTWTDVSTLAFITPNITATGAKDGNDPANRTTLDYTIRNLSIPDGSVFLIRWIDFNASGADDGLAVDDFIIEVNPIDIIPPAIVSVSPVNGATNIPVNISAVARFDEEVLKGTGDIRIRRSSDNSIFQTININSPSVTVSSASMNFTLSNLEVNTGYYIEVDNSAITDLDRNGFEGISGSGGWAFTTGINLYVAGFQNCTSGISDGFTQYSVTGDIVWGCTTFGRDPSAPTGTAHFPNGVQINGFSGGTNVPNIDWLISPAFDLTATSYPLLSFWSRTAFNGQPLQLKISTNYVSGDPALATWIDINGRFPSQTSNTWALSENINLSAFKQPNVHIAFVYFSDDDEGARWTIDDLSLANSPTPPPPSLTVSTTSIQFAFAASGVTADKTFSFTGNDLANDITLNAAGAFTLSKDGVSFSSSLLYTVAEANNLSKTVYVRFAPTQNNQNFTGTISISTGGLLSAINLSGTSIDPATTLEVVNWNIEWFGSTTKEPTNDILQEQNVKTILQNLDADVYALTELVSEARLVNVVSQMPGYAYVLSNYGSHTNTSVNPAGALAEAQKLGFIYKTSVLTNITTTALLSQGINSASDITNPAYNYWASGRFPFMMSADVTLNCVTKNVKFVLVHGKANTSPTATSYDRRKRGADTLHYTLQQNYADDNVIILGDYNDDLDQSITAGFTTTSWNAFTNDAENFEPVTLALSIAGKKSTVSYNDVIDHVIISNDLEPFYMDGTANILSDVSSLVSNYAFTTSDHYPVFSRYRFSNTTAPSVTSCTDELSFCITNGSTYTVPAFVALDDCGDVISYNYVITGATERSGLSNDASGTFNIGTSLITWTATDSWGNAINCETTVIINANPTVTIPDANALPSGTVPNTVYIGYTPASSITLTAQVAGGTPGYFYSWSDGSVNATATVSPTVNTTYTVSVTDNKGCLATANKDITVLNIRGGKKLDKVIVCHKASSGLMTLIVEPGDVADHLAHGDMLGSCPLASQTMTRTTNTIEEIVTGKLAFQVLPNPSANYFTINIRTGPANERVSMKVTDILGRTIEQKQNLQVNQSLKIGTNYNAGLYFIEISQGKEKVTLKLVKL